MNSPSSFQNTKPRSSFEINTAKYQTYDEPPHAYQKNQHNSQQNSFGFKKTEIEKPILALNPKITESGGKQSFKNLPPQNGVSPINSPTANRPIPAFLQGKPPMKASLMSDQFSKNLPHPIVQSPKRSPRMSEHYILQDIKTSSIQFGETKMPSFLQKNSAQKEPISKKKQFEKQQTQQKKNSTQKQLTRATSSKSTLQVQVNENVKMKKSSFDPTASWVKQSWSKKKQKKWSISDFDQIKQLGSGKYGQVYLAKEKKTNFICALKIIQKKLLKQEEITEQFIRQLKIQMYLNHPNIIKMYGFFDDNVNIYIILEVGTGGQLFKHLKKFQNMPQQKVATLMRQICQAINEIHSCQIIHRDLKPENIVIHDNIVKLCDFGWSVHMDKNLRTTFCGTPLYVCPQILRGKDYDEKIDIWSLGVMMYEMVVGENPFKITKQEELIKIVKDAVVIPSYVDLSKEAKDFLDCCLQKNPEQRANIRELLNHSFFKKYPEKSDKKMGI